ncbi:hypothetical protein GCM10014719_43070 [Planomonospora parontospora subsp. antibiotica]|nr:hypothetical protein GCM10014719_43070 [Planomonospora parontospora subsp. antibiotica]GII17598.1 hypothetical protein Ppa05_43240 [Planomonospora parontospora subsp. antibiotica]
MSSRCDETVKTVISHSSARGGQGGLSLSYQLCGPGGATRAGNDPPGAARSRLEGPARRTA